jgi:large subunit ribosomal protein LP0
MSGAESTRKQVYFTKLIQLLNEYDKIFIVGADNVGSNQMQNIRKSLRGKGVVLMGKNTMIRKAIRGHLQNNPNVESLLPSSKETLVSSLPKMIFLQSRRSLLTTKSLLPQRLVVLHLVM